MKFQILICVLSILSFGTLADEQLAKGFRKASEKDNNENNNVNNVPAMADEDKNSKTRTCKPAICSRIYKPVCGLVNGIPLTAPSMCHFQDKQRCLREILDAGESK